jgi:hypothetical protein
VAVHDVDMNHAGAGGEDLVDGGAEAGEIRRQD